MILFTRRSALAAAAGVAAGSALAQVSPPARQTLTRIAFGSCANQEVEQPIWDAILAYRPELFIFAGDNIYGDYHMGNFVSDDSRLMETLQAAYAKAATIPGMSRLRATTPHLAVWDDHDYGKNDAGAEFVHREEAQRHFMEFWKLRENDPRRSRQGTYYANIYGPQDKRVQVILLDTRYFRSPLKPTDQRGAPGRERYVPDDTPGLTILGDAQWRWLEQQLRQPAELRLIVSSIQVVADGHGWERWGNFPRERQRLYDLIASTGAGRVVFLSGDRHIGALYRETSGTPYPIHDVTSSGLTQFFSAVREAGPNRIGAPYGAVNFGTIDIDWWEETVTFSLRNLIGERVRTLVLKMADLQAR